MKNQIMGFVKRELLSVLVATMVLITALPVGLFDVSVAASDTIYSGECGDDLTWTFDGEGTLTISGTGTMANWSDSSSVPWYSYRSKITKAIIEDGVTSIGNYAFYNCRSLISADIPVGVTSIGVYAFGICESLTSIDIPVGVTSIGNSAFYCCTSLISTDIPVGVTSIGDDAFAHCKSLTSIDIPDSVTSIGDDAFYYCTSLISADIPDGVTSIGNNAFYNCTSLISADIPDGVTSIGKNTFAGCKSLTSIDIPDSVTSIGDYAFSSCTSLTSIDIPDSVTSIGRYAFSSCSNLNRVNITDIEAWCKITFGTNNSNPLYYAKNLYLDGSLVTEIVIPDGITSIGNYAFYNCESLTSADIPTGITSIGNYAFYNCASLTSADIPTGVTSIGNYAFDNCTSLTSIFIPKSVMNIGTYAFRNCTSLTSITVDKDNPKYSSDERGVLFNKPKTLLIQYPAGNTEKSYTIIPNSTLPNVLMMSIAGYAFSGCTSLESVVIPDRVVSIFGSAFSGCTSLESIVIPDSVTSIDNSAFNNCKKLTIHGNFGSYAQSYATQNNIPFNAIDNYITSEGVQIRTSGKQGLRFIFSMPKTLYDNISKPTSVENTGEGFGAVVMPKRYLGTESLIKDTVTTVGGKQYAAKTVPAVNIYDITEDEVRFTVVITEISEKNYTAEYVVVPYTTYISGGKENTSYFELNSISIYSVAQSIYNYGYVTDAEKEYLYNNILTVVDPAKYPPKN